MIDIRQSHFDAMSPSDHGEGITGLVKWNCAE